MKHLLLTTIAAVVLVGCGPPEPPDISLTSAAIIGNIEAVKQHIAAGTDVNAKEDANGKILYPLFCAAMYGHKEIVELLITKGGDVNLKGDIAGFTSLHGVAMEGHLAIHKEIAELLIAEGANVNAEDMTGSTPLNWAAEQGHWEIAELLIIKGANVNAKDDKGGKTPLHRAVDFGQKEVVELLLRKGADVSAKDDAGMTPLHGASGYQKDAEKIAELLLANGAEVNAKIDGGWTPLNYAELASGAFNKEGAAKVIALLRKHGGKTGGELKIEELKQILASTEGEWKLSTRGKDRKNGRAFSKVGTVTINWDDSKSELRMESRIKRKGRTFKSLETITINNEKIMMDKGGKPINGIWNPSSKKIIWLTTIDSAVFGGSSDYSIKDRISQTFSVQGLNVSSTETTELKAEGK